MSTMTSPRSATIAIAALVLALMAAPRLAGAQSGGVNVSFTLGPTLNWLNDVDFQRLQGDDGQPVVAGEYPMRVGFAAGLNLAFDLGPAAVRAGAGLLNTGALFDGTGFLNEDSLAVNFLTFRLDAQLRQRAGPVELYLVAGPEVRYLLDLTQARSDFAEFRDNLEPLSATASVGAGLQLSLMGYRVGPELRYALDLTGISGRRFDLDDESYRADEPLRLNSFLLALVVGW